MGKMFCQLVKQQSAPTFNIAEFDGNLCNILISGQCFESWKKRKLPIHKEDERD